MNMNFFESFLDNLVPICALLIPVAIVWLVFDYSHRKEKERNELIKKMIEKGEDPESIIPLLDEGKKEEEKSPTKHVKSGITLLSVGLGLVLTDLICDWNTLGVGAFIGVIGLGEIAVAWYLRKYSK